MTELNQTNGDKDSHNASELSILPDSSWLISYLDESDSHHRAVDSSFGAILPYKPIFYIPAVVYMETISRLVRVNKMAVKKAYEKIEKFLTKVHYKHSTNLEMVEIIQKYKAFSRVKKIKTLRPIDFHIATEGISLGAKILTCDLGMYDRVIKHYPKIYLITDKIEKKKSDLGRLIEDIQSD